MVQQSHLLVKLSGRGLVYHKLGLDLYIHVLNLRDTNNDLLSCEVRLAPHHVLHVTSYNNNSFLVGVVTIFAS